MKSIEQTLFKLAPAAFAAFSPSGIIQSYNPTLLKWWQAPEGTPAEVFVGKNITDILAPDDRHNFSEVMIPALRESGSLREHVIIALDATGTPHPVLVNADLVTDEFGVECVYAAFFDAEYQIAKEHELILAKQHADEAHARLTMLQQATSRLAVARSFDDLGNILAQAARDTTQADWAMVCLTEASLGEGQGARYWGNAPVPLSAMAQFPVPNGATVISGQAEFNQTCPDLSEAMALNGVQELKALPIHRQSESGPIALGSIYCWSADPQGFEPAALDTLNALIALVEKMIQHLRLQNEVLYNSTHDSLTALPNHRLVHERLTHLIGQSSRSGHPCAVLFLDLDGFKAINDQHSHAAGDAALRVIAKRIRSSCRAHETVGRLGGDEFVVIVEDATQEGLTGLANRLLSEVRRPLHIGDEISVLTTSIGAASWSPADGDQPPSATALLHAADSAMYSAKRAGRGTFVQQPLSTNTVAA